MIEKILFYLDNPIFQSLFSSDNISDKKNAGILGPESRIIFTTKTKSKKANFFLFEKYEEILEL